MRAWLIAAVVLLGAAWRVDAAHAAPILKPQAVVEGDHVQLGDLFADLPASADASAEVARAPAPGKRITLDASTLMSIANSQRIGWQPGSRFDHVDVERAGQVIGSKAIHDAVMQELQKHGLPSDSDVTLDSENLRITVAGDRPVSVRAESVTYDPGKPRFEMTLVAPADGGDGAQRIKVQGKAYHMVDMPVPVRPIGANEVIRGRDIEMVRMRADQVSPTQINDPDKLVDKAARRVLPTGQPIRVSDVAEPILVSKNSIVNVKVISARLDITMQGKALDDGAEGDQVRVVNTRSNKIVQGVVSKAGEVVVTTSYTTASTPTKSAASN
ncbi:MAG TPA: flagellar basal body P-ring formation chaperone FlgA [Candidatus Sulfotelmatobacter sp.]|nr:flagellar basal body P-ring formation chaperone FlgA [Candidatus Sulfotelmatobacter sp.]